MTKTGKRHVMKEFRIDEASFVDKPAQEGAVALFMKRAPDAVSLVPYPALHESLLEYAKRVDVEMADEPRRAMKVANAMLYFEDRSFEKCGGEYYRDKAVPVLTSNVDGHSHMLWLRGERGGETSYSQSKRDDNSHSHGWVIGTDGLITMGESRGHTHAVDQSSVLAAMREMLLAESVPTIVADVVFARSADGALADVSKFEVDELVAGLQDGTLRMSETANGELLGKAYLPDGSYPIRTQSDLASAIASVGASPSPDVARHITKRARVLGLEGQGGVALAEIAKFIARPAGEHTPEVHMTDVKKDATAPAGAAAPTAEAIAKMQGELELAKAEATLTDRQRAHYGKLEGAAKADFLKLDSAGRDAAVTAVEGSNPVVFKSADGTEFRKNDDPRLVALAKRNDEQAAALAKAVEAASTAAFEKRAGDELPHLAGSVQHRAALLKAVDGIADEAVRKGAHEALKAGNAAAAGIFLKRGTNAAADASSPAGQLDALAKARALEKGEDFYTAYQAVSDANPALAKAAIEAKPAVAAS